MPWPFRPSGRKALRSARNAADRAERALLDALPAPERQKFVKSLSQIASAAEAYAANGAAKAHKVRAATASASRFSSDLDIDMAPSRAAPVGAGGRAAALPWTGAVCFSGRGAKPSLFSSAAAKPACWPDVRLDRRRLRRLLAARRVGADLHGRTLGNQG